MRIIFACVVALLLAACESDEEKQAQWNAACRAHEFSETQCQFLGAAKHKADNDAAAAAAAAQASGLALGLAIGQSSGSR